MKKSIWQVNDLGGHKLGLLMTESFLDIIDVTRRAYNKYSKSYGVAVVYLGDVDEI